MKVIETTSKQKRTLVIESPPIYNKRLNFIETDRLKKGWIFDIIDGSRERHRVIHRENEFLLVKDSEKFSNWLIIYTDKSLYSIRSLTSEHIPMLLNSLKTIQEHLPLHNPMIYFHYPPSVWQLHLHIASLDYGLKTTKTMQKVVFLHDVLSSLAIDSNFYAKATITFITHSEQDETDEKTRKGSL